MTVEVRKTNELYEQFAAIFTPILSEQLKLAGAAAWELSVAQSTADASQGTPLERIVLPLRFEGALAGQCFIAVDAAEAAVLAGSAAEPAALLAAALQTSCEPLAAALFAHYGTVHVHAMEESQLPDEAVTMASLSCPAAGISTPMMHLYADAEMQRGLARLARVAAAAEASGITSGNLGLVMDVELNVTLRFGQRRLSLREVMDLSSGSVVELDREVDEPVELILDGRVIARGEAVIVDGNYGVRVTEVLQSMAQ